MIFLEMAKFQNDQTFNVLFRNGVNRLGVEPATASRFVKDPVGGDYTVITVE
jgi:hypothetical protein